MFKVPCIVRNNGGISYRDETVYSVNEYTPLFNETVKKKRNKTTYMKDFATFDIETTSITHYENGIEVPSYAFMYVWQCCINGTVIIGRTWLEWLELLHKLHDTLGLGEYKRLVIYVHNLAFEFSFLAGYINDYKELFATAKRKPITWYCDDYGVEFRCSQKLTNKSLFMLSKDIQECEHIKAKDDLDYKLIRHSDTPLTPTELGYCVNDVLGLWECIKAIEYHDGVNMATIETTSTGYVRHDIRDVRHEFRNIDKQLKSLIVPKYMYNMLQNAFRGGDTHANKFRCNHVWEDVYSFDAVSMYPAMQLLMKFPMGIFETYHAKEGILNILKNKAWFAKIKFTNIRMKDDKYNPYLSISKCTDFVKPETDNGRVWSAVELVTTITDIDYKIICDTYDFDAMYVANNHIYATKYDYLPKEIRAVILKYFKTKCILKFEIKNCSDPNKISDLIYAYHKSKEKLNAIYGLSATNPLYETTSFDGKEWKSTPPDDSEYRSLMEKSPMLYQWGVWTTAHARQHLRRMLDCVGADFIYCDTDSCKALSVDETKYNELNKWVKELCEKAGAFVDVQGKRFYIGVFENETNLKTDSLQPTYCKFKTLGAKRYGYIVYNKDGTIANEPEYTIAGVSKSVGGKSIASLYMQTLDEFKEGVYMYDAGGNKATYHDSTEITQKEVTDYLGNNGIAEYTGYNCLSRRDYTLSLTDEQRINYNISYQVY